LIIRQHQDKTLQHKPNITAQEFKLLQHLQQAGLAVQTPYHLEEAGTLLPTPALILEYVQGDSIFTFETSTIDSANYTKQSATYLAQVHNIGTLSFLPTNQTQPLPSHWGDESTASFQHLLTSCWPLMSFNEPTLLHGDFWPGNLLWHEGRLTAVIDWEDAKLGDPLQDLAIARFDLCFIFGIGAMNQFTQRYRTLSPQLDMTQLPYWDLYAALRAAGGITEWAAGWPELGRSDLTEEHICQVHQWFIEQALEKIVDS